jgi:predicted DNA binding protein
MLGTIKKLVFLAAMFFTVLFVIFVINQTNQLVSFAAGINTVLGQVVLYTLLILYAFIIAVPLVALFKRPGALIPPADVESEAYRKYLVNLTARLSKNPLLKDTAIDPGSPESIEEALKKLNKHADERIKENASSVFIMTAISQYGALDAVIVILSQFRMIWQVAVVYNQRPTLNEITYLYSNVFATAFLATKIENLDFLEDQLEPVIASIMGSSLSSLTPALNTAANVITNAVIQGSANAFLTLRVGVIARYYCASIVRPERSSLRHAAAVRASALLAIVLGESTYKVTRAVVRATAKTGRRPFRYGHGLVTGASKKTWAAGKATLKKSEDLARSLGNSFKESGKKFKYYFKKPKAETGPDDDC